MRSLSSRFLIAFFPFCFFLLSLFIFPLLHAKEWDPSLEGRILFLAQRGEGSKALTLYLENAKLIGKHDFDLLHRIGLALLNDGCKQKDPEIQLLSLFGASVAAHEDAYHILEEGLKNRYPQIQLIALQALAQLQNDQADEALLHAMGSNQLLVRLEALQLLCKKKHPEAVSQTESLMYKASKQLLPLYPPFLACVGTPHALRILRKFFHHSSENVRLSVILSATKYKRDDLLPQIRLQAIQSHYSQQEACACALGLFHDSDSTERLKKLTLSQYPCVAIAALLALYRVEHDDSTAAAIENLAEQGDIFAIAALGELTNHPSALIRLLNQTDIQIRANAALALLKQRNPICFPFLSEILFRQNKDLAFTPVHSPGKTLKAWKVTSSASKIMQEDDLSAYQAHLELKEWVLENVRQLSEKTFIQLAHQIFKTQQAGLIPLAAALLEEMGTNEAIDCLKAHQQQLGAPLVRLYCNLALYRLQEKGPYGEQLRLWVKSQNQTEFLRLKAVNPWDLEKSHYALTPEENSQLLIQIFESFAINQDLLGVEALIEAIAEGNKKNKYALAGLLLRATQ